MTPSVTVVDYGSGNLLSIARGLEESGAQVELTGNPASVAGAERLVVPGVGAFGTTVERLTAGNLVEPVLRFAESGRPFLGICVGMQMLLDYSEEFGKHDGLGLIPGHVSAIPATGVDGTPHPVPHIGWNGLLPGEAEWDGSVLDGLKPGVSVYFVHSFRALPEDTGHVLARCDYDGWAITAAVVQNNVTGCQFHPEKSGPVGLAILRNFIHGDAARTMGDVEYG